MAATSASESSSGAESSSSASSPSTTAPRNRGIPGDGPPTDADKQAAREYLAFWDALNSVEEACGTGV